MKKINILLFIVISLVLFISQFYLLSFIRNSDFERFEKENLKKLDTNTEITLFLLEKHFSELDPLNPKTVCSYNLNKNFEVTFDFRREIVENHSTKGLQKHSYGLLDFYGNVYAYHHVI